MDQRGYQATCKSGLLTKAGAAPILECTPANVAKLADSGELPSIRTASGIRLFRRVDVEALAAERAAKKAGRCR